MTERCVIMKPSYTIRYVYCYATLMCNERRFAMVRCSRLHAAPIVDYFDSTCAYSCGVKWIGTRTQKKENANGLCDRFSFSSDG